MSLVKQEQLSKGWQKRKKMATEGVASRQGGEEGRAREKEWMCGCEVSLGR